jgi:hypothetical protein
MSGGEKNKTELFMDRNNDVYGGDSASPDDVTRGINQSGGNWTRASFSKIDESELITEKTPCPFADMVINHAAPD